jgi:hypothetical protein
MDGIEYVHNHLVGLVQSRPASRTRVGRSHHVPTAPSERTVHRRSVSRLCEQPDYGRRGVGHAVRVILIERRDVEQIDGIVAEQGCEPADLRLAGKPLDHERHLDIA